MPCESGSTLARSVCARDDIVVALTTRFTRLRHYMIADRERSPALFTDDREPLPWRRIATTRRTSQKMSSHGRCPRHQAPRRGKGNRLSGQMDPCHIPSVAIYKEGTERLCKRSLICISMSGTASSGQGRAGALGWTPGHMSRASLTGREAAAAGVRGCHQGEGVVAGILIPEYSPEQRASCPSSAADEINAFHPE